jgi:hypothetical protein
MKKLIIVGLFLLGGCAIQPSLFDNVLYDHVVTLNEDIKLVKNSCGTLGFSTSAKYLKYKSDIALSYSEYRNTDVHNSLTVINKDLSELDTAYENNKTPSKTYCDLKLQVISEELKLVIQGLGEKQ